jgi:hypothetical protein
MELGPLIAGASLLAMVFSAVITRFSSNLDKIAESQRGLGERLAALEARLDDVRKRLDSDYR